MSPKTQILCILLFDLLRGCFIFRLHIMPSPPPRTPQHTIQVEKASHLNHWLKGQSLPKGNCCILKQEEWILSGHQLLQISTTVMRGGQWEAIETCAFPCHHPPPPPPKPVLEAEWH